MIELASVLLFIMSAAAATAVMTEYERAKQTSDPCPLCHG